MILRLVLSAMILVCCAGAGMVKAQQFGIRFSTLQRMIDSLRVLEAKMVYSMGSMPALLRGCAQGDELPEKAFFSRITQLMEQSYRPLAQCWRQALKDTYTYGQLSSEDLSILNQLGMELGTTDLQGQQAAFSNAYQRLETQLTEAAAEKKKKEKLYRGVGIYIGLLIPLVLL